MLSKDIILKAVGDFAARGSKPTAKVQSYAKWQRILKVVEKYDQNTVVAYNIFLALILRFLQLSGKVRIADNEARKAAAKANREVREERIKEAETKKAEKEEKLQAARTEAEGKEEAFDEEAWNKTYDEENPPIEIGD